MFRDRGGSAASRCPVWRAHPRGIALLGLLVAMAATLWIALHRWPLAAGAAFTWRVTVLAPDFGFPAGAGLGFALATFGATSRLRGIGWWLVLALLVAIVLWTRSGLTDLLVAARPPLGSFCV